MSNCCGRVLGCERCGPDEEVTRPDHVTMQHWRRLVSAFDGVPVERRELFLTAVAKLAEGYAIPTGCNRTACKGCKECFIARK